VRQGDVVWVSLPEPVGSALGGRRPVVVLQHDRFNRTRIATAIVVAITSKLKYAGLPLFRRPLTMLANRLRRQQELTP
jgi:mRNA interferase MazF